LSKTLLAPFKQLFSPPRPHWACEFTSRHLIVAGVDSSRKRIAGTVATPISAGTVVGALSEKNLPNLQAAQEIAKDTLSKAGMRGFEISVVIPDDSSRIAFITAENLTGSQEDRETFVRWKLKKTVPFDVDSAKVAYRVLGPHSGKEGKGIDVMVALSPKSIVQEYEELLEKLDLHAGLIMPSTLAVLNLGGAPPEDSMFVKIAPGSISTTIFQNQRPRFYRRVGEIPLYDAVYPTIMYYQDKLEGTGLGSITLCGYESDSRLDIADLQNKLGIPVRKVEPKSIDDIYKPALGAVELVWANLI
jgi:type IV pilus assembly protein PilM